MFREALWSRSFSISQHDNDTSGRTAASSADGRRRNRFGTYRPDSPSQTLDRRFQYLVGEKEEELRPRRIADASVRTSVRVQFVDGDVFLKGEVLRRFFDKKSPAIAHAGLIHLISTKSRTTSSGGSAAATFQAVSQARFLGRHINFTLGNIRVKSLVTVIGNCSAEYTSPVGWSETMINDCWREGSERQASEGRKGRPCMAWVNPAQTSRPCFRSVEV